MTIPTFIETDEQLQELCTYLQKFKVIALDTEFIWTRTYFPILGIIQIAVSEKEAFIVDTVSIKDPASLTKIMVDETITKVIHDAHQDIVIINRYIDALITNTFDTQLAAAFSGFGGALSLERLIKQLTGVKLAKTETRTNWLKRPLDPSQIEYALDDVRYLLKCYDRLKNRLDKRGTLPWLLEEMELYDHMLPFPFEEGVLRQFKRNSGRVQARSKERLYRLVELVEQEARSRNLPREHIIRRDKLSDLASSSFTTIEALTKTNILTLKSVKKYGEKLVEAVTNPEPVSKEQLAHARISKPDTPETTALIAVYTGLIHGIAYQYDIEPSIVISKADTAELIRNYVATSNKPELLGWRGELLNKMSDRFLLGDLQLKYDPVANIIVPILEEKDEE